MTLWERKVSSNHHIPRHYCQGNPLQQIPFIQTVNLEFADFQKIGPRELAIVRISMAASPAKSGCSGRK